MGWWWWWWDLVVRKSEKNLGLFQRSYCSCAQRCQRMRYLLTRIRKYGGRMKEKQQPLHCKICKNCLDLQASFWFMACLEARMPSWLPPLFGFGHSHSPKVAKFEFTFLGTEKIAQQPIYCLPSRVQCKVGGVFFFSDLHISVRIMDFSSFLDVATFQSFRCLPKRGINFSISPFPDGGLQLLCRAVA